MRFATQVEPHVKIDDDTGRAEGQAFFYAENLPPDSLLYSVVGVGPPRRRDAGNLSSADEVAGFLREGLDGRAFQVGADATTGRGVVHARLHFPPNGKEA